VETSAVKYIPALSLAALGLVAACRSDSPTEVSRSVPSGSEVVITEGASVPVQAPKPRRPSLSVGSASISMGGSATTPVTLTPQSCSETASQAVVVTYSVKNNQEQAASFKVNTRWEYDGTAWTSSVPTTVSVPKQGGGTTTTYKVTVTLVNASAVGSGDSSFSIAPFDLQTSGNPTLQMNNADVTVNVAFDDCAVLNSPPTLVMPDDITDFEATSSAGAAVPFLVTATDLEDGDLTSAVICDHNSGDTFPLGTTKVVCEVTDSGGLTTTDSFEITVVDTTPAHFTSIPTGTVNLVAADINGATLDVGSLGIAVADVGGVSEPSSYSCDYVAGTVLEIGSTTTVSCRASDAIGNTSEPSTFDVFVGLNVSATGFLSPLRVSSPFSTHKRGSTIPHKFLPPTYADGTPATDLASGLRLVITHIDGTVELEAVEVNDYSAGSTTWRYDDLDGQYIFNLKSVTSWDTGTWRTAVSYKGITLATTEFNLKK
jgi:hypothetical protein